MEAGEGVGRSPRPCPCVSCRPARSDTRLAPPPQLTRAPTGPQPDLTVRRWVPAAFVAVLVAMLLGATVVAGFRDVHLDLDAALVGSAEVTGETIFRRWVLPFEVLSVLLLAALVGAIVLSRLRSQDGDA